MFMLNSAEHEISNAHKYKMSRNSLFLGSDKPRMLYFLLINVKMPTTIGILKCMSRKKLLLSEVEHEIFMISEPGRKKALI